MNYINIHKCINKMKRFIFETLKKSALKTSSEITQKQLRIMKEETFLVDPQKLILHNQENLYYGEYNKNGVRIIPVDNVEKYIQKRKEKCELNRR